MKAGIFFTGSGPILVLTSYGSFEDPRLVEKLAAKGIAKFIAYEVPVDTLRQKYGSHYDAVLTDLRQEDDLRVLDYDGHHVFHSYAFSELGPAVFHEAEARQAPA